MVGVLIALAIAGIGVGLWALFHSKQVAADVTAVKATLAANEAKLQSVISLKNPIG